MYPFEFPLRPTPPSRPKSLNSSPSPGFFVTFRTKHLALPLPSSPFYELPGPRLVLYHVFVLASKRHWSSRQMKASSPTAPFFRDSLGLNVSVSCLLFHRHRDRRPLPRFGRLHTMSLGKRPSTSFFFFIVSSHYSSLCGAGAAFVARHLFPGVVFIDAGTQGFLGFRGVRPLAAATFFSGLDFASAPFPPVSFFSFLPEGRCDRPPRPRGLCHCSEADLASLVKKSSC